MQSVCGAAPGGELKGWLRRPSHQIRPRSPDSSTVWTMSSALRQSARWGAEEQRTLYEGVDGCRPLTLEDLVPTTAAPFSTVRHFGKNSLPVFTHFEKRFCRPRSTDGGPAVELYGFNFQTMAPITGPGYFIARDAGNGSEVLSRLPPRTSRMPRGMATGSLQ